MSNPPAIEDRPQTPREELANALSHGAGLIGAVVATPILVVTATGSGDAARVVGASIFGATMILMYLCSTLYHALPRGRAKRCFVILDHSAIFLFIAGSYTPFTLGAMRGPWGWSLFGVVWAMAALGILLKFSCGLRYPRLSLGLYLSMGWLSLIAIYPLWKYIEPTGLLYLLAGGLAYTGGVAYFITDHKHFNHARWHLFVLLGTAFHFLAVWGYVI